MYTLEKFMPAYNLLIDIWEEVMKFSAFQISENITFIKQRATSKVFTLNISPLTNC